MNDERHTDDENITSGTVPDADLTADEAEVKDDAEHDFEPQEVREVLPEATKSEDPVQLP
jgi:hypothetical protein